MPPRVPAPLFKLHSIIANSGWYIDAWDTQGAAPVGGAIKKTTLPVHIVIVPAVSINGGPLSILFHYFTFRIWLRACLFLIII
jgi:hypothetical protein